MRLSFTLALAACGSAAAPPEDAIVAPEAPGSPVVASDEAAVIASWSGGALSAADLHAKVGTEVTALRTQYLLDRYELENAALQNLVDEQILQAAAEASGHGTIEAYLVMEIERKTPVPSDKEVRAFYDSVKRQLGGASFQEAEVQLRMQLHQQAMGDRFEGVIKDLRERYQVDVALPYPDLPRLDVTVKDDDPTLGPDDAPVTIVQFAEYQCYYCAKVTPAIDQIMRDYAGQVRLVYKDFPLNMHTDAVPAAVAAHCAGDQGKYWEMSKVLLNNQSRLSGPDLARYAEDLGLAAEPFLSCMDAGTYEASVYADLSEGQQLGVQATPTFFVNGMLVSGAQPFERFAAIIDRELAAPK